MLKTKEEYEYAKNNYEMTIATAETLEVLRAVARAVDTFSSDDNMLTWDFDGRGVPDSYYKMCKAIDALPAWVLEE